MVRPKIKEESLKQELLEDPEVASPGTGDDRGRWRTDASEAGIRPGRQQSLKVIVPTQDRCAPCFSSAKS